LIFLALVVGASLALFAWRTSRIGLGGSFDPISREAALLTNNVLLMAAAGVVMLGTLYPLVLDALGLGKISVGPPYFEAVFMPLMAPALFLMGIGPLMRWKKASLPELAVRLRWAFAISVVIALVLPFVLGRWSAMVSFGLLLAVWIATSAAVQLWEKLGRPSGGATAWARLRNTSRSYHGMLLAHLGIAVFVVGVTLVKGYETELDVRMAPGDTVTAGGFIFRMVDVVDVNGPNYVAARGTIEVTKAGKHVATLRPEKRVYKAQDMPMTEAAINRGITRDLYVSMGEAVSPTAWVVRVQHKPFVNWIWGGCVLMALGGLLAASDRRYRIAVRREREAAEPAAAPGGPQAKPAA
ncbi:MAG: cytochrome c-type biogenesis CcmF C-terminal domain-containing protein, partial [Burkholderiales bacterium]|nr:cytochrome c-type biogenesis CcmF C-terminal domain-containing protein [Burkholderiales bacterium]